MYMYKGVSREEWIWRGLAIAMILAVVGMTVMLVIANTDAALAVAVYLGSKYADVGECSAGLLGGGAAVMRVGLKLAEYAGAYAFGLAVASAAVGVGLAL